jgi:hypothetical protein
VSIVAARCRRLGRNPAAIGGRPVPAWSGRVAADARAVICRSPTATNACPRRRRRLRRRATPVPPAERGPRGRMTRAPSGSSAAAAGRWPRNAGMMVRARRHGTGTKRRRPPGPHPAPSAEIRRPRGPRQGPSVAIRRPRGPRQGPSVAIHRPRGPSRAVAGVLRHRRPAPSHGVRVRRRRAARRRVETEADGVGSPRPHGREAAATIASGSTGDRGRGAASSGAARFASGVVHSPLQHIRPA